MNFTQKGFRLAVFTLIAVIVLNSVVIASPLRPAVITHGNCIDQVFTQPTIVFPFTRWTVRPRYHTGQVVAIFAAPTDDEIWVVRATYSVKHSDILQPAGDWETWLSRTLNAYVDNLANLFYSQTSAELTTEQRVEFLVQQFSDQQLLLEISDALVVNFNKAHEGIMRAQGIRADVVMLSLNEFLKTREGG